MGGGGFAEWPRLPLDFPGDSVKNLPATKETPWVGKTPPLEEGTTTHSSVLAGRIPGTEEPGGLQSVGSRDSDTTERLKHHGRPSLRLMPGSPGEQCPPPPSCGL